MNDQNEIIGDDEVTSNQTDDISDMDDTEMNDGDEVGGDEVGGVVHDGEIVSDEEANQALSVSDKSHEYVMFYNKLGSEVATEVRSAAEDAKHKMLDARDYAVEAGRILNRVRGLLAHGQFGEWLKLEFGQTDRTARNLMGRATAADTALTLFGHEAEARVLDLPPTVAYKLGSDTLPNEDRTAIIEAIARGDLKSADKISETINDRKAEARKRRGDADKASGKGKKDGSGDGEGEGDGETFAEKKKKRADALRHASAFSLAVGLVVGTETDEGDKEGLEPADIVSLYGEIGSGPKRKLTAEDHAMTSEMIFSVSKAYNKGGMDAVNALKPVVPDEPVAKAKKGKKAEVGDD